MALSATYFDWKSFRAAVDRDWQSINEKKMHLFTERVQESTCEILFFRVWYQVGDKPSMYCGDQITGPVNVWLICYRKLLELAETVGVYGLVLEFKPPPDDLLPVVPCEEERLA